MLKNPIDEAVEALAEVYHSDLAMRDPIIGKLVKAGIIEKPIGKPDPRSPAPALKDIKALKLSFFDNGPPMTWRGKEAATKREFGLDIHAWTVEHAKVRSDAVANWKATVPLWNADFAAEHTKKLLKKKQICQTTFDVLDHAIAQGGDQFLYGVCFNRGAGSGWIKNHVVVARVEDRRPVQIVFQWGNEAVSVDQFTEKDINGKKLQREGRPIFHARIAFDIEHADWCNDVRY